MYSVGGSMPELVAGLDIGSSKIAALIGELDRETEEIEIAGVGKAEAEGVSAGVIADPSQVTDSVRKAVGQAEDMASAEVGSVNLAISGEHMDIIEGSGVVTISTPDKTIDERDVRRVLEVAQSSEIPQGKKVIQLLPRQFKVDGQEDIEDPIGMQGRRLEVDLAIIVGSPTAIRNHSRPVESLGIGVERLLPASLACSKATLQEVERKQGVLLMDIGDEITQFSLFEQGQLRCFDVIPVAGSHLTKDLTVGLSISFEEAERIKQEIGLPIRPNGKQLVQDKEFQLTTVEGHSDSVSHSSIANILEPRIEELFDFTVERLQQAGRESLPTLGVVLAGGSSSLNGLPEFLTQAQDCKFRTADPPPNLHGLKDVLHNPIYQTALGLLEWELDPRGKQFRVVSSPQNQRTFSSPFKWLKNVFR